MGQGMLIEPDAPSGPGRRTSKRPATGWANWLNVAGTAALAWEAPWSVTMARGNMAHAFHGGSVS